MTLPVKKEQEHIVSKGGSSSVLYLPREYFTPGERISSQLEIDPDGNLRMVLMKRIFAFTCDDIKTLIGDSFNVEYDKTIAGIRILSATRGDLSLSCTKPIRELEPTRIAISRRFDQVRTSRDYIVIADAAKKLAEKGFDVYIEPEGETDVIKVYKDPQRHGLRDEVEAVEALNEAGKKIGFSIFVRFNSKENKMEQIKAVLESWQ